LVCKRAIVADHGVENGEGFSHGSDKRLFLFLVARQHLLVIGFQDRIVMESHQGGRIENTADFLATTANPTLSVLGAAVVVEGSHAGEGGDLLAVKKPQFGEFGGQAEGCDKANTGGGTEDGRLG